MARQDDLLWWMRRPAGLTDQQAVQRYGVLSPLSGDLAQTQAVDYGPEWGIGTGPGRKLVLRDPEDLARVATEVAALQSPANPWAGRVMGDTIGGAQANWLSRRGQDLSAIASARAMAEQQRQFNARLSTDQQARQDRLAADTWARQQNAAMRQAEMNQRAQDSLYDYMASLARTDTQSRDAMARLERERQTALMRGLGGRAAPPEGDLGELLRAHAEIQAQLRDAEDTLALREQANPSLGEDFLHYGEGPVSQDQDLVDLVQQLRRAALLSDADVQAARAARPRAGAGTSVLSSADLTPYPTGGIDPSFLISRATSPFTPTRTPLPERGNVMNSAWRGNYGASSAYGTSPREQERLNRRLTFGPSPSGGFVFQTGGLPVVAPPPTVRLRLTPDGQLVPQ